MGFKLSEVRASFLPLGDADRNLHSGFQCLPQVPGGLGSEEENCSLLKVRLKGAGQEEAELHEAPPMMPGTPLLNNELANVQARDPAQGAPCRPCLL